MKNKKLVYAYPFQFQIGTLKSTKFHRLTLSAYSV